MTPDMLVRFFQTRRFPINTEGELQHAIAAEFDRVGIGFEREVRLSGADIVDFMVGAVAIEVKIGGGKLQIFRQCERYCAHQRVAALVLAASRSIELPEAIAGKPVRVASLGRGWL